MRKPDLAERTVAKYQLHHLERWQLAEVARALRAERRRAVLVCRKVQKQSSHPYNHWLQSGFDEACATIARAIQKNDVDRR